MAARRVISLVAAKMPQIRLSRGEVSQKFHPSPIPFSRSYIRGLQSTAVSTAQLIENQVKPETHTSISNPGMGKCTSVSETNQTSSITHEVKSNLKESKKKDHAMIFNCKVCNVRSVKILCRESYEKGVVVARCDGCNNLHLLVDRLGLVGEHGSIEEFLSAHGKDVEKDSVAALNLMLEDPEADKKDI